MALVAQLEAAGHSAGILDNFDLAIVARKFLRLFLQKELDSFLGLRRKGFSLDIEVSRPDFDLVGIGGGTLDDAEEPVVPVVLNTLLVQNREGRLEGGQGSRSTVSCPEEVGSRVRVCGNEVGPAGAALEDCGDLSVGKARRPGP